jgi:formylglycine-generating enzyme required for sulfatase activity
MKYCQVDGHRYSDDTSNCRACGSPLVLETELSDPSRIATSCCPNPECSELVAEPNTTFCRKCGTELKAISVELWLDKFVGPVFEKNPLDTLISSTRLFASAAEMGLEKNEVKNRLDRFIMSRAGVSRTQVDEWLQDVIATLIAGGLDSESARRQALQLATDRGISTSFSFQVVDAFIKAGRNAKTTYKLPFAKQDPRHAEQPDAEEFVNTKTREFKYQSSSSSGAKQESARSQEVPAGNSDRTQESKDTDRKEKRKNLKHHLPWSIVFIFVAFLLIWGGLQIGTHASDPPLTPTPVPTQQTTPSPSPSVPPKPENMVSIAEGEFYMGRDDGEALERPAHPEKVAAFLMDKFEVTREDYKKCIENSACDPPHGWDNNNFPSGTDKFPVTGVSWDDARKYCTWVKKRLPTEAEWEYAARGSERKKIYPWGEEWMEDRANTNSNGLREVGTFKAQTNTELYDLIGNAWEWTASKFMHYPGKEKPTLNKSQRSEDLKVIRGGYFGSKGPVTATYRGAWLITRDKSSYAGTGFRCVQSDHQ